uniref:G_PROTEIN_RECEP_F1_2 domain-containing protein n=1 Tax=Bursaphelenchus xylophilus TaxID=6326 RepID=A0A1I7RZV4_BURXY
MAIDVYSVVYYITFFLKTLSIFLNLGVWRLLNRGRNDVAAIYKYLLKLTVVLDCTYALSSIIFGPMLLFSDSYFILIFESLLLPKSIPMSQVSTFIMTVVAYGWIGTLPVQPIVRYYTLISQPCSKRDINVIFSYGILVVVLYGICTSYFVGTKNEKFDYLLANQTLFTLQDPMYVLFDSSTENIYYPLIGGVLITVVSCILVFVYIMKARRKMISMREHLTEDTRRMHRRMRNIVISQTIYPLLCLEVPAVMFGVYPLFQLESAAEFCSIYSNISLHVFSILNPLSIIFFIPSHRRAVMDTIRCKTKKRNSVSMPQPNS